jgi:hypothetical protein
MDQLLTVVAAVPPLAYQYADRFWAGPLTLILRRGAAIPLNVTAQARLVADGPDGFLASILPKRFADVDEWQTEMQLKPMRVANIHLYTEGLNAADRALTGVNMIDSIEQAIARSIARSGDRAVAVIPEGPYVVPYHAA